MCVVHVGAEVFRTVGGGDFAETGLGPFRTTLRDICVDRTRLCSEGQIPPPPSSEDVEEKTSSPPTSEQAVADDEEERIRSMVYEADTDGPKSEL
jgi:hypothetical protein